MKKGTLQQLAALKQSLEAKGVKNPPPAQQKKHVEKSEIKRAVEQPVKTVKKATSIQVETTADQQYLVYDFIDIEPAEPSYSFKKRGDLTGELTVQLVARTPIIAVAQYQQQVGDAKLLPASSVRGMVRTVAEILWDEALTVLNKLDPREVKVVPPYLRLETETTLERHRLASHLFGFAVTKKGARGNEPLSLSSALTFTDAIAVGKNQVTDAFLKRHALSTPNALLNKRLKVHGLNRAYLKADGKQVAGRKLYLAGRIDKLRTLCYAPRVAPELKEFVGQSTATGERVRLIHPGAIFEMKIRFKQLTEFELASLIRVLELTPTATHAIGRGKPLGFGRLQMQVKQIAVQNLDAFFDLTKKAASKVLQKEQLLKQPHPFEQRLKELEERTNLARFDGKKAYTPPNNTRPDGSKIVAQYFKQQNG